MSTRAYRFLKAFILAGLCFFLVVKLFSGKLSLYINTRFVPLTVFGIILLAIMALSLIGHKTAGSQHGDDTPHDQHGGHLSGLVILVLPLLIGILIPSRPLDATAASTRGMNVSAPLVGASSTTHQLEMAADTRNILDWIRIFNSTSDLSPYLGQTARVTGFVYHDPRLGANQFIVSRFVITCCAADASAIGMLVTWDKSNDLKDSAWVEVKGPVQTSQLGGQLIPLIQAVLVQPVDQPNQPYLYP
ncbi:MAG TPA: TIGR03943 family protein [Anaerolineales bacterium]|nr:TIGR03943 family protein [Anaerolineales bacterium]